MLPHTYTEKPAAVRVFESFAPSWVGVADGQSRDAFKGEPWSPPDPQVVADLLGAKGFMAYQTAAALLDISRSQLYRYASTTANVTMVMPFARWWALLFAIEAVPASFVESVRSQRAYDWLCDLCATVDGRRAGVRRASKVPAATRKADARVSLRSHLPWSLVTAATPVGKELASGATVTPTAGMDTHRLAFLPLAAQDVRIAARKRGKFSTDTSVSLQGAMIPNWDVETARFTDIAMQGAVLSGCRFNALSLVRAQCKGIVLYDVAANRFSASECDLEDATLINCILVGSLHSAKLINARLVGCDLSQCDLTRVNLSGATLINCIMPDRPNFRRDMTVAGAVSLGTVWPGLEASDFGADGIRGISTLLDQHLLRDIERSPDKSWTGEDYRRVMEEREPQKVDNATKGV